MPDLRDEALRQLRDDLRRRGIRDERVLEAIATVPRDFFVPPQSSSRAWEDRALPLSEGQTISQPYIVARMTELARLQGWEQMLEIGTGSGYQTAILATLARKVVSIERIASLQLSARKVLDSLGFTNIEYHIADGTLGWPPAAPYDAILATAAAPSVPEPLYQQLQPGGRLVVPVGDAREQVLQCIERGPSGPVVTSHCACRFVPLIGKAGWSAPGDDA